MFGGFAQVIMLCGSLHYISLFDGSRNIAGFTGAQSTSHFWERSSRLERGKHMSLYFCHLKQMNEYKSIVTNISRQCFHKKRPLYLEVFFNFTESSVSLFPLFQ